MIKHKLQVSHDNQHKCMKIFNRLVEIITVVCVSLSLWFNVFHKTKDQGKNLHDLFFKSEILPIILFPTIRMPGLSNVILILILPNTFIFIQLF